MIRGVNSESEILNALLQEGFLFKAWRWGDSAFHEQRLQVFDCEVVAGGAAVRGGGCMRLWWWQVDVHFCGQILEFELIECVLQVTIISLINRLPNSCLLSVSLPLILPLFLYFSFFNGAIVRLCRRRAVPVNKFGTLKFNLLLF